MTEREQEILDALRHIQDPDLNKDIVSLGFVRNIRIDGSRVRLEGCRLLDRLRGSPIRRQSEDVAGRMARR